MSGEGILELVLSMNVRVNLPNTAVDVLGTKVPKISKSSPREEPRSSEGFVDAATKVEL